MVERVMPDPWFRATSAGRRIGSAYVDIGTRAPREGERAFLNFILPPFQRPAVWSSAQKVALIESIYDGLPFGSYVVNRTTDTNETDGWLLDGQQRWTAIAEYVAGDFPVYGWRFPDLPKVERSDFMGKTFTEQETRITSPEECRAVYDRLAYGGTAHDPASRLRDTQKGVP